MDNEVTSTTVPVQSVYVQETSKNQTHGLIQPTCPQAHSSGKCL